jgi:hypothetical protein
MKVTQVQLINQFCPAAYHNMIVWLPSDEYTWKKGMRVELKDSSIIWTVFEVYSTQNHYEINRKWDVGGL